MLSAVWWLIGMPVTLRSAAGALRVIVVGTLLFTALSVLTLSSVLHEPSVWVVVLVLAGMLAVAYRTHRKVVGQQQATQRLYDFVKDLGPLDLGSPAAPATLERMRVLLHAQRLDLAILHAGALVPPRRRGGPRAQAGARPAAGRLGAAGRAARSGARQPRRR